MPTVTVLSGYPDTVGAPVVNCAQEALVLPTIFNRNFQQRIGRAVVRIHLVETDTSAQGVADTNGVITFRVADLRPGPVTVEIRAEHPDNGLYRDYRFVIGPGAATEAMRGRKLITSLECDAEVQNVRMEIPVSHSRRSIHVPTPTPAHTFQRTTASDDLNVNAPVVVLKNSGTFKLTAATDPVASNCVWTSTNTADDSVAGLGTGPEIRWTPAAAGLFRIRAALGGSSKCIHVVVAEVSVTANSVTHFDGANVTFFYHVGDGYKPYVVAKLFDDNERTVFFDATLRISAGGNAQADAFLNKIHAGFANNLSSCTVTAAYNGGTRIRERVLTESLQRPRAGGAPEVVRAGDAFWGNTDLSTPILDRGGTRGHDQAMGGDTIFLAWNEETPAAAAPAHTRELRVTNKDKPTASFQAYCPISSEPPPAPAMRSLSGEMRFRAWLLAFSDDCNYTYLAMGYVDWTCLYDIRPSIPWENHKKSRVASIVTKRTDEFRQKTDKGASAVEAANALTLIPGGQEAEAAGCEVRPPVYKDAVYDTR